MFTDAEIDCYKCDSKNNTNPHCGDPFHPYYGTLEKNCRQSRDGRSGLFPASYCTKISGVSMTDNTVTVIRSCALESLENMCGMFDLEGVRYTGCVLTCDSDACNGAKGWQSHFLETGILVTIGALFFL
ncbi:U-scoloptoxin(05)-Cw1a-like [Argopecten irradians]|uniref:U-scoloptoxin(05)-Cw1a-like n=1 Tax=Argopecten irradians TaxID=31199 RepID=UPI0037182338